MRLPSFSARVGSGQARVRQGSLNRMSPRNFERPATISLPEDPTLAPGSALEGLWLPARGDEPARGGAVVAAPHPLMGGTMESPVATELGLATSDQGYVSLRFNWRGVGGSAGLPSGETTHADIDYCAALDFMEDSVDGAIVACGYSWGGVTAARVATTRARVKRLVMVSPPAAMLDGDALKSFGHPILIITGDRDEYVPLAPLKGMISGLEGVELEVLEGVDHFFMAGLADIGRITRDFLDTAST
jgi:alpha/beta superfamily hydrolase